MYILLHLRLLHLHNFSLGDRRGMLQAMHCLGRSGRMGSMGSMLQAKRGRNRRLQLRWRCANKGRNQRRAGRPEMIQLLT